MPVIQSKSFPDGLTPMCATCCICLCWDIGVDEYEENKVFWDSWKCADCNPDAPGSRKRFIEERA